MNVRVLAALVAVTVAGPALAEVSLGLEATIGGQRLGMRQAPVTGDALLPMGDLGATVLLRAGTFAVGVAAEGNFERRELQRYNASALGGLALDVFPVLRLELLGELGAANLRTRDDLASATSDEWTRFYGVRPGLSAKIPVFPLRVGVWGLARWGLPGTSREPALGVLGRIGLEF
jgi:hypothetical protein